MDIRAVQNSDLDALLRLYTHLHGNELPERDDALLRLWRRILDDPDHHILAGFEGDRMISSVVVVIVPNLTQKQRPYALVENVITHPDHRGKGHATALLHAARDIAVQNRCYKIMLMTGSKEESTLRFYERAGYNREDKTAFIQWLKP